MLSDGYPSLLRLAELLSKNPGYRVRVEGHTDSIGSNHYNDKLGMARASTVRDFLVKYGAKQDQIQTSTRGKAQPEVPGEKRRYSKTDVARWMNRRVVLTVTDAGADGKRRERRRRDPGHGPEGECCCPEAVLRRDPEAVGPPGRDPKMLRDMNDQNAALRKEVADLRAGRMRCSSRLPPRRSRSAKSRPPRSWTGGWRRSVIRDSPCWA